MSAVREIAAGAGGTTPVPKDAANARGSRHNRCHNKTSLEAEFEPFVSVEGRRLKQKRQCQNALPLLLFWTRKNAACREAASTRKENTNGKVPRLFRQAAKTVRAEKMKL